MAYQVLYRKWRPLTFDDVAGQENITGTLRRQIMSGRLSHAYLFTGTRGTGKTTCAKILARAANCENPKNGNPCNECKSCKSILDNSVLDIVEIDAASNNGVDNIRDIRDEVIYTPANVRYRVYIIDEVHMLSTGAFNALLKTLEEPPEYVLFILATTEAYKVPATVLSRCQRFDFRRIPARDILKRLRYIVGCEGLNIADDALLLISELSDGSLRDGLSILDRISASEQKIESAFVLDTLGISDYGKTLSLFDFVLHGDLEQTFTLFSQLYIAGRDIPSLLSELMVISRDMLFVKTAKESYQELISPHYSAKNLIDLSKEISVRRLLDFAGIIEGAMERISRSQNKRTDMELCLIRLCSKAMEDSMDSESTPPPVSKLDQNTQLNPEKTDRAKKAQPVKTGAFDADDAQRADIETEIDEKNIENSGSFEKEKPVLPVKAEKSEKNTPPAMKDLWSRVLGEMKPLVNTGVFTYLKLADTELSEGAVNVFVDEESMIFMEKSGIESLLREKIEKLLNRGCKVKVMSKDKIADHKQAEDKKQSAQLDDLLDTASRLGIDITVK